MDQYHLELDIFNDSVSSIRQVSFDVARIYDLKSSSNENWFVGVSRMYIPADLITPYAYNSTTTELSTYKIGLYQHALDTLVDANDIQNVYDNGDPQVVDLTTLINACNRKLIYAHRNIVDSVPYRDEGHTVNFVRQESTLDITNVHFTYTKNTDFAVFVHTFDSATQLYGINAELFSIEISNFNLTCVSATTPKCVSVSLLDKEKATEVVLFKDEPLDNIVNINFADYYANPPTRFVGNNNCYPVEMFSKLYSARNLDQWALKCEFTAYEDVDIVASFQVKFIYRSNGFHNTNQMSTFPPYLQSVAGENSLMYSESNALTGLKLIMSKTLNSVLKLPSRDITINGMIYSVVDYPSIIRVEGNATNEKPLLKLTQPYNNTNTSMANDLFKIVLSVYGLPIEPTITGASSKESLPLLTNFIITEYSSEFYQFNVDYPNRLFKILSSTNISNFTIVASVERENGIREPIYILPQKRANILLSFYKK